MSLPWPKWSAEEWRTRLAQAKKRDYVREPAGTSEGGQFAETGGTGVPTPDPVLAVQAKAGIAAVEKLIPQAVQTADFSGVPGAWYQLSEAAKEKVFQRYSEQEYDFTSTHLDTYAFDTTVEAGVYGKQQDELLKTAQQWTSGDYSDTVDPKTIIPDPQHLDWIGDVPLKWDELRHLDGRPLNRDEINQIQKSWHDNQKDALIKAVAKYKDSDEYLQRREQLVRQTIKGHWDEFNDKGKYEFATTMRLSGELPGNIEDPNQHAPTQWVTGVETGTQSEDDYARTHAVALKLTELRMDELLKERGLSGPVRNPPVYTIEKPDYFNEAHPQYLVKNAAGVAVASSNTVEQATANAKEWADAQMAKEVTPQSVIRQVWDSWKVKSSEGLGLSLQLAAARELGGHHRMTPDEVVEAETYALDAGGMPVLQAYVRAQWEVTQTIMQKAGEDHLSVYRGLMLPEAVVAATPKVRVDNKLGQPLAPPTNITPGFQFGNSQFPTVSFDFNGEHFVAMKERVQATDIRDVGKTEWESDASVIERRLARYDEDLQRRGLTFTKLPALQLQRAGAQSTTGTRSVANDWGGVGTEDIEHPTRVVIRIAAPATSVLSLPVYGQNMQEEHESVLMGTKDRWVWDAWWNQAPAFESQPITPQMTLKSEPLIIDLQTADRGKPHWMTGVDWSKVQKFDEAQHPRDAKGQFAPFYHGTSNEIAEKILQEGLKPLSDMDRSSPVGKAFAATSEKVAISYAAMASDDSVDTITVIVFKPEASQYFKPANKHAFGPPGSWPHAIGTEMSSTETVPPEMIQEVRQYKLADVLEAIGPRDGKQYADWETPLEELNPVRVVKKADRIYVAILTNSGTVVKWEEAQHPRDDEGQFTRVAMTSQRLPGDPGHMSNTEVFQHMDEFHAQLDALPGVSSVSVKPGVGGWEGGSESMWQIYYKGNGEARKLVARTAKAFNQDSVLILNKCEGVNCQPAVELSFEGAMTAPTREHVHKALVANGIHGWTWMKRNGKTILRMVCVPQWGGEAKAHQQSTVAISQKLREDGLQNHRRVHKVAVSVMEREGAHSYDTVIGS